MMTLNILAERARKKEWKLTNDEAIDIWTLIPEGCKRDSRVELTDDITSGFTMVEYLNVKGLGSFRIMNFRIIN